MVPVYKILISTADVVKNWAAGPSPRFILYLKSQDRETVISEDTALLAHQVRYESLRNKLKSDARQRLIAFFHDGYTAVLIALNHFVDFHIIHLVRIPGSYDILFLSPMISIDTFIDNSLALSTLSFIPIK